MFHQKIQNIYSDLSKKEREISAYLLNHPDLSTNFPITELAEKTNSSPATITRFVHKLGFDSFVDFKIYFSNSNLNQGTYDEEDVQRRVFNVYQEAVRKTNEVTDMTMLNQSVEIVNDAKNIYVIGVGSSGLSARELSMRLVRMGSNAVAWTDVHMILMQCRVLKEGDVVITISASGQTREIVEALDFARKNRAIIISFTSTRQSPVAKLSNISIEIATNYYYTSETIINSQFSIMYQLDIFSNLLLEDVDKSENMRRTTDMIIQQKYLHE